MLCIMNESLKHCFTFYIYLLIFIIMLIKNLSRTFITRMFFYNVNMRTFTSNIICYANKKMNIKQNIDLSSNHDSISEHLTFVPISIIKQYLLKRDVMYSEGHTCISIHCPLCNVSGQTLFINKISGSFICDHCKKSGSWTLLELFFNSKHTVELPDDDSMIFGKNTWSEICKKMPLLDSNFITSSFVKELKVPLDVYLSLGARMNTEVEEIYFPLLHGDQPIGYKILKNDFSEESFPFKGAKGLITNLKKNESVIIVPKLLDFLTLQHLRLDFDVICLPHGSQSMPQEILPLFEKYNEIVLWFGNDNVSFGNAKMFAKKLSESRCSLVRPLENQPSPFNCYKNGIDIMKIIKNAQPVSHSSIVTFANLREDVLTELYNADKVSGVKWERFPNLNTILKGHRRGELTILTGPTGSGKTTFMSEYSLDLACNKVTTLWGSFEIRNQRLAKTMMTQMFHSPLEKNLDKFNEWADQFERLPIYFMTFHGQQPLNVVMEAVEHATYVHDVAHVIIDNVQFMLGMSSSESGFLDRFYRQDALIASFRNFATTFNCHVTLVIHPRKEREGEQLSANSIFGGAKAAQEADNILIIQHKTSHTSLRLRKFLQIAKNRFSGDLGIMPLEFDKESLSFRTKQK